MTQIRGHQAILQREAFPGEGPGTAPGAAGNRADRLGATGLAGSAPSKDRTLVELVNGLPMREVARDTWDVSARDARELGSHVGALLAEALTSARPSLTLGYGIALNVDTSLGTGTLDRRGFLIDNLKLASQTGLELGDRILFVNDQPVNTLGGLYQIYTNLKADSEVSEVKVVVNRDNQRRTLTYRLR